MRSAASAKLRLASPPSKEILRWSSSVLWLWLWVSRGVGVLVGVDHGMACQVGLGWEGCGCGIDKLSMSQVRTNTQHGTHPPGSPRAKRRCRCPNSGPGPCVGGWGVWVDGVGQGVAASLSNQRAELASTHAGCHTRHRPFAWPGTPRPITRSNPTGGQTSPPWIDQAIERISSMHHMHPSHHRSIDRWIEPTHATHTHAPDGLEQVGEARLLGVRHGECSCLVVVVRGEFVVGCCLFGVPPLSHRSLMLRRRAGITTCLV